MFWRGFIVLCVLGASSITFGAASLSSSGNGTKISSMNLESVNGGHGQNLKFGTEVEVEELVSTAQGVDVEEELTTKDKEKWGISAWTTLVVDAEEKITTTEVWASNTVDLVSTRVPVSTSLEGDRTSRGASSSGSLLRISRSRSNICGWMETAGSFTVSRTVSATGAVRTDDALIESSQAGGSRGSKDGLASSTPASTSKGQSSTEEAIGWIMVTSVTMKTTTTMADHTTAFTSNQGSISTPFNAPTPTTRSEQSAVDRMAGAGTHNAQTSSNSTTVVDLEESRQQEDNEDKELLTKTRPKGIDNAVMAFSVDDEAALRSDSTTAEDLIAEAPQTSVSTILSSFSMIVGPDPKRSANSTYHESSLNEEESLARNNGTTETERYSGESNTPLASSATISAEDTFESLSLSSDNRSSADTYSEAGSSNFTGTVLSGVAAGSDISSSQLETLPSQNVTADAALMLLNITLAETMDLSAEKNAKSSILSTANGAPKGEIHNTTSISSTLPESNTTLIGADLADTALASISITALAEANGSMKLNGFTNNSNFMPACHSTDILSILAGSSTPSTFNNTSTGALVVFALPSNQSTVLSISSNNDISRDIVDGTNTEMGSSTALPDSATSMNTTVVGDQSIALNDTKIRQYDTLYKINETVMDMGSKSGTLTEDNTIAFVSDLAENPSLVLNESTASQPDNMSVLNSTAFVGLMANNDTAIVGRHRTAPIVDRVLNMSLAYPLDESANMAVVVDNVTSGAADTPCLPWGALSNNTEACSSRLKQAMKGFVADGNSIDLNPDKPSNGTAAQISFSVFNASLANRTVSTSDDVGNLIAVAEIGETHSTNDTASSGNASFISVSLDLNEEVLEGTLSLLGGNKTVLLSNGTSSSAIKAGILDNLATISNGTEPNNHTFINIAAINYTDLADAQVRRYISGLTNALHMSQDNLKDLVCTDESLISAKETLSRDGFELVEQACLKLWEKQSGLGTNETAGSFANITESIEGENLSANATAWEEQNNYPYPSLANFTRADGNVLERLGPIRTSTIALLTKSISISLSSSMQSATETSDGRTSSNTISTLSTSFTSASTSNNFKATSTSSSMRPKMTACADDFDFFDMTDANLDESGTISWYMNWTAISAAEDGKFNSLGEVRYFGQQWLKDSDYDCGLEHGGCTRRPSCNDILSLYPDDAELARRIYFVMKMHFTINTVMKSYYDAIQLTHQNVAAQIHTIISTTMQTPHFDDAAACQFIQTSYSNIQTILIDLYEPRTTMEGKGWNDPWFVDDLKYTTPSAQGIWWLQYPDPITHKEKGMTKWVHGRLMLLYRMWFKDSIGRMDASLKLCDGLGIVNQDRAGTEEKLKLALSRFSTYQRKELSKHVKELNEGKFYEEGDPSVLSSMLTMGIWNNEEKPQSALNLLSDPYQLEEMMTNQSKEGILSQSYIQQKCYMKCVTHPHALLICEGFNDWEFSAKHALKHGATPADSNYYEQIGPMSKLSEAEKNMRICPESDKVCQVECWSQEKKGWSMPLHGINQLGDEPLGVDIQQKMKDIYAYYKENGNVSPYDQPQDPAKDMEANLSDSPKPRPPPKGPHFWLPVCDSDQGYTHIVDFGQQRHNKYNLKQHSRGLDQRSFPVSCGSFRSDQTVEFMEAMGLTNHHSRDVSWTMDPFFQNYAALNLAVLIEAPLDNFLAFCALGIAYPQNDHMDSKHGEMGISRKGSRWCEPIAQETEGMGWYMANLWFCRKSPNARELFKNQGMSGAIVGLHKIKNHRALCRRWLAQAQGEAMGGLDEIDGSQSKNRKIGPEAIGFPHKIDAYRDRSGKGGNHGHAPVTEDGRSKGWFDVMNRKKGNGKRHKGAEEGEDEGADEGDSGRVVTHAEEAAKRKHGKVVGNFGVEIDVEEAKREEKAYWKAFAALTDDEESDEIESG